MTNPDRAKATESQDGSGLIKQALACLDTLRSNGGNPDIKLLYQSELRIIRSALQHVALEAECWAAIEAWRQVEPHLREYDLGTDIHRALEGKPFAVHLNYERGGYWCCEYQPSRLEALTAAATFCRAELAK